MVWKPTLVFASGVTICSAVVAPVCEPCNSQQTQLTQAEAQEQLDLHNKFRRAVHSASQVLPELEWNCDLMCQAQAVGDTCTFAHSGSYNSPIQAGENLATGTDGTQAAWMWFQEYASYQQPAYTSGTGHYTAMVWESTNWLGCGKCSNPGGGDQRTIYVCQYANTPPNFGFQGTNYYALNAPVFAGTKSDYSAAGIAEADVRTWLGRFCGWVQWVPSFQSACDALASYDASPSLLQISSQGKQHFRKKGTDDEDASSLLQTSIVATDNSADCKEEDTSLSQGVMLK